MRLRHIARSTPGDEPELREVLADVRPPVDKGCVETSAGFAPRRLSVYVVHRTSVCWRKKALEKRETKKTTIKS